MSLVHTKPCIRQQKSSFLMPSILTLGTPGLSFHSCVGFQQDHWFFSLWLSRAKLVHASLSRYHLLSLHPVIIQGLRESCKVARVTLKFIYNSFSFSSGLLFSTLYITWGRSTPQTSQWLIYGSSRRSLSIPVKSPQSFCVAAKTHNRPFAAISSCIKLRRTDCWMG